MQSYHLPSYGVHTYDPLSSSQPVIYQCIDTVELKHFSPIPVYMQQSGRPYISPKFQWNMDFDMRMRESVKKLLLDSDEETFSCYTEN